jgi:hypothetical protein
MRCGAAWRGARVESGDGPWRRSALGSTAGCARSLPGAPARGVRSHPRSLGTSDAAWPPHLGGGACTGARCPRSPAMHCQPAVRWPPPCPSPSPLCSAGQAALGQAVRPRGRASAAHAPVPSLAWMHPMPAYEPQPVRERARKSETLWQARSICHRDGDIGMGIDKDHASDCSVRARLTTTAGPIAGLGPPQLQRILLHVFADPYTDGLHLGVYRGCAAALSSRTMPPTPRPPHLSASRSSAARTRPSGQAAPQSTAGPAQTRPAWAGAWPARGA